MGESRKVMLTLPVPLPLTLSVLQRALSAQIPLTLIGLASEIL